MLFYRADLPSRTLTQYSSHTYVAILLVMANWPSPGPLSW